MDMTAPTIDTTSRRRCGALALAGALALSALAPAGAAAGTSPASTAFGRVVVTTADGGVEGARAAARAVRAAGGTVLSSFPLIGGVGAELPVGATLAPAYDVVPDRPVRLSEDATTPADGPVSTVRETLGVGAPASEGRGVLVAVVDTGVEPGGDLAGRVLDQINVTGDGRTGDDYGHGTFVAGLIAGSGAASGGAYAGVAPAATILDVRVAKSDGTTDLLTVLKGLEEVAIYDADGVEDHRVDVDVLNLSLSSDSPLPYHRDPLTMALGALWDSGVTVVVPAGNTGPRSATVTSPGIHPALLTVGAVDEDGTPARGDDTVAAFSARGPAQSGAMKPELVAPGRSLVSLGVEGSAIHTANPSAQVEGGYFVGSGTSFSTAVTAGAAAAVLGEHVDLLPPQVKGLFVTTAYQAEGLTEKKGAGSGALDLRGALQLAGAVEEPTPASNPGGGGKGKGRAADETVTPVANSWSANSWSANSWSANSWSANSWSANSWSANSWSANSWSANSWSANSWSANSWSANSWSANSWSANSWSANSWSANSWSANSWSANSWSAHSWGDLP